MAQRREVKMKLIDRTIERNLESWFWRYHSTWLITLAAGLFSEAATRHWDWPPQSILMVVVLALATIVGGGMRNGLMAASIITFYVLYHQESYDSVRIVLLIAGAYSIALGGGYLKNRDRRLTRQIERLKVIDEINQAKINFVDDLNGNIEASKTINELSVSLITEAPYLTKDEIIHRLTIIQDMAADLAQRALGWHKLYEEKKSLIDKGDNS